MFSLIFQLLGWLISFAFNALIYIYGFIVMLSNLMSKPFQLLWDKLKAFLDNKLPISGNLNRKFSAFNGFGPFVLLIVATVFSGVSFWISSYNWDSNDNYFTYILYNTTLGSFIGFMNDGLDFTPATLVAIAFTGSLMSACMDAYDPEDEKAPIYIRIPCYVVYLVTFSILAIMLSGVFQTVGQWGYETILALYHKDGGSFWAVVGKILAMIPLCYVALLLCLITVRTYAECCVFGILGMIILIVGGLLLQLIPDSYKTLEEVLTAVFALGLFFGLDVWQGKAVAKVDELLDEKEISRM